MAHLISVGNFGGIAGSNIFIASQAPKYPTGFGVGLGMCVAAIIMAFTLRTIFEKENRKRRELLDSEGEEALRARFSKQEPLDSKSVPGHCADLRRLLILLCNFGGRQESILHLHSLGRPHDRD